MKLSNAHIYKPHIYKPHVYKPHIYKQRGLSGWAIMILVAMIGVYAITFFKMVPVYLDHFAIKRVLNNLEKEPKTLEKSKKELTTIMMKRMSMNNVSTMGQEDIKISKKKGVLTLQVEYEARVPLFGNVDMIVSFDDSIEANVSSE